MLYDHAFMVELETTMAAPLTRWEDGSIRIIGSRVPIESILYHFKQGASAERIQESFPSLTLREIYGAIFYYLDNVEAVEEYLRRQESRPPKKASVSSRNISIRKSCVNGYSRGAHK